LKDAQENEDRIMLKEKSKGSGTNKKTDWVTCRSGTRVNADYIVIRASRSIPYSITFSHSNIVQ
jgi:hypothetical protein